MFAAGGIEDKRWGMTVDEAFELSTRHSARHYENFPRGSWLLPREQRRDVCAVHAFARAADEISGEAFAALDGPQRLELLERWEGHLDLCLKGESKAPIFLAVRKAVDGRRLPVGLFRDLISAFKQDVTKGRYANFEEVKDYCRRSANPIGRLVLHIFGQRDEESLRLSDRICTALRLARFWQDMSLDLRKDKIYLPQDEMENFGVTEAGLKGRRFDEGVLRLMQFQVRRTRELFDSGRRLPNTLDNWGIRTEIRLAWLGGVELLNKIEWQGFDTLHRRPGLSKLDRVRLLAAALRKW